MTLDLPQGQHLRSPTASRWVLVGLSRSALRGLLPLAVAAMVCLVTLQHGAAVASAQTPLGPPAASPTGHSTPLAEACPDILDRLGAFPGEVGFAAIDLTDGTRCFSGSTAEFATASLYKLVVMAEAFRQEEAGLISFDAALTVVPADHIDDSPAARPSTAYTLTVGEALERMIQVSDNGTASALRRLLGEHNVAAATARLAMPGTSLDGAYRTNAADIAHFFLKLHGGHIVSPAASEAMLDLLGGQLINDRLPAGLPAGTRIAHKTGNLDGNAHDAGLVYTPAGDFVIVVLTNGGATDAAYALAADLATMTYAVVSTRPPLTPGPAIGEPFGDPTQPVAPVTFPLTTPPVAGVDATTDGLGLRDSIADAWWSSPTGAVLLGLLAFIAAVALGAVRGVRPLPGLRFHRATDPAPAPSTLPAPAEPLYLGNAPEAAHDIHSEYAATAVDSSAAGRVNAPLPAGTALSAEMAVTAIGRDTHMRFGARAPREHHEADGGGSYLDAASDQAAARAPADTSDSPRLQRISRYFNTQATLLQEMEAQVHDETAHLAALLVRQQQTMNALLASVDNRLRPLDDYAATEERNLANLEQQMNQQGMDFIARSFAEYMDTQRRRITDTRDQITAQRAPFERYGADQHEAIETALSRFDEDVQALEDNLVEQRKVMMRMLDAMRSDVFVAAREFLTARAAALQDLAEAGVTDPVEIGTRLRGLRAQIAQSDELRGGPGAAFLRRLIEAVDDADARLLEIAPARRGAPSPIATDAHAPAPTELDLEERTA